MPPAKRAARSPGDPTPEVSSAAAKASKAVKKAASRKARATGTTAAKSTAAQSSPTKATAAQSSPTKATAAQSSPTKARPAKASKAPAKRATPRTGRWAQAAPQPAATQPAAPQPADRTAGAVEVQAAADAAASVEPGPEQPPSGSPTPSPNGSTPTAATGVFRADEDPSAVRDAGRARRKQVRRQDLGAWSPPAGRPDPVDLINETNVDRLPSLIPLRWTRMLESPFAYLRGAAAVMAHDLAGSPTSGLTAQICGDAHVANFGLYAAGERQVLDVNDFDESLVGPWEFDVKRLATSIVVAGRVAGVKERACRDAAAQSVRVYREVVSALADLPALTAWSASLEDDLPKHVTSGDLKPALGSVSGKVRRNSSAQAAKRIASQQSDGGWRFDTKPPELTRLPESEAAPILAGLEAYAESLPDAQRVLLRRFRPVDVALRVGGLSSIGLRTYVVLLHGNGSRDPLVLQVKEARVPTVARYLGGAEPDRHQGRRTVAAQQLMQTASDPMLGWTRIDGRDHLVRQLQDTKGSVDPTVLKKSQIAGYGALVGALLARSHCRSLDPRLLAGYLGKGEQADEAIADFALSYAEQTRQDHTALVRAADEGRIPTI